MFDKQSETYENFKELLSKDMSIDDMIETVMNDTDLTVAEMNHTISLYKIMFIQNQYDSLLELYESLRNSRIKSERFEILEVVVGTFDKTSLVEDLLQVKRIFNLYLRNVRNITDKARISRMFKEYVDTFICLTESKDYFRYVKERTGNIGFKEVVDDISSVINDLEETK